MAELAEIDRIPSRAPNVVTEIIEGEVLLIIRNRPRRSTWIRPPPGSGASATGNARCEASSRLRRKATRSWPRP